MVISYWLCVFSVFLPRITAQSFPIPANWRKPTSNLSSDARLDLVTGFLNTVTRTLNQSSGGFDGLDVLYQTPSMLCGLAIGDRINGSTTNKNTVLESLNTVFNQTLRGVYNGGVAMWGLAATNAYRAYNDEKSLQYARSVWTQLNPFVVTLEDASSGKHPTKNVTILSTCRGGSTAGAVFEKFDGANNTNANAQTTAACMTLSAHLYELTSEQAFLDAAELSAAFVTGPLSDGNIIIDTITLQTCATSTDSLTYDSGLAIDGLAVLGSKNGTYASLASGLISTVIPNPQWTSPENGTISIEVSNLDPTINNFPLSVKTILIRGLYEAYTRISVGSPEAALIRSFILVQFNALIDIASTPGSNQYSPLWFGPPPSNLLPWGQLAAVDTLYSAVALATNSSGANATTSSLMPTNVASINLPENSIPSSPGQSTSRHSGFSSAAIGGIVVGVVILLLVAIGAIFVMRRRKQRVNGLSPPEFVHEEVDEVARIDPWQYTPNSGASGASPALAHKLPTGAIENAAHTQLLDAPHSRSSDYFGDPRSDSLSSAGRGIQQFTQTASTRVYTEAPPSYRE